MVKTHTVNLAMVNAHVRITCYTFGLYYSAALVIQIYIQMDRIDLARKEVTNVKSWAEDALLAQLLEAWVDLRVVSWKQGEAYELMVLKWP
jgi:hypothetical protein